MLGGNASHITTVTTASSPPSTPIAIRTPSGRKVCGNVTSEGPSEPTGMDVRGQDSASPEVPQLVHHPLGLVPPDHGADRDPALPMQRGHGGALDAGRQR